MFGGALLFGAARRIIDNQKWSSPIWVYASAFAVGAIVLAISRPFEGLLACLLASAMLVTWLWRSRHAGIWNPVSQLAIPFAILGSVGIGLLLYNNQAVTGDIGSLPYAAHSKQYSATSMWIWKDLPPTKEYNLNRMESYYHNWSRARQLEARSLSGFTTLATKKLNLLWRFFPLVGGICLIPLLFLVRRDRWLQLAVAAIAVMLLIQLQLVHSYTFPHYIAPIACLFYVLLFQGLRYWQLDGRRNGLTRLVMPVVVVYSVLSLVTFGLMSSQSTKPSMRENVAKTLHDAGGKHLVFVDYVDGHNLALEWVYNGADIDGSEIIWANTLSDEENDQLLDYYPDRQVWVWHAPLKLEALGRAIDLPVNTRIVVP